MLHQDGGSGRSQSGTHDGRPFDIPDGRDSARHRFSNSNWPPRITALATRVYTRSTVASSPYSGTIFSSSASFGSARRPKMRSRGSFASMGEPVPNKNFKYSSNLQPEQMPC